MNEPTETPLPALWQRFLDQVAQKAGGGAPTAAEESPYRAMQLYLDIEERAVRLAVAMLGEGVQAYQAEARLAAATTIARHLRTRLGLPADPTPNP